MKKSKVVECEGHDHPSTRPAVPPASLERAAGLFAAMADPARLRLLDLLAGGERCVSEIAAATADKLSTVSQRLRLLRQAGLVARRRAGTHLYYALADGHVADLIGNALAHARELDAQPPTPTGDD